MSENSAFAKLDEDLYLEKTFLKVSSNISIAPPGTQTINNDERADELIDNNGYGLSSDYNNNNSEIKHQPSKDYSLIPYFKQINRFKLLSEEEEKELAIRVKEGEAHLIALIAKFDRLLKQNLAQSITTGHKKEILKRINETNIIFSIFEQLIDLEKTRKQIIRSRKHSTHDEHNTNELENQLSTIESAISKKIGQMSLTEHSVRKILRGIRKSLNGFTKIGNRSKLEWELAQKIREIKRTLQEIRSLKNKLVTGNLRLVITIAKKYLHHGIPLADLIQEGNLGLIRAIDTYDHRRGHRFVTYAVWWIRQAVLRMIDCHARTIRIPVYMREKMNKVDKVSSRLYTEGSKEPSFEEIAEAIDSLPGEIEKIKQSFNDTYSIDELTDNNKDLLTDSSEMVNNNSVLEQAMFSDLKSKIGHLLSTLTRREREIVKLRFGIDKRRDHTLDEIGKKMGLSRERIRQIIEKVLMQMKSPECMRVLQDYIQAN
jgi:RNA polymerase sigma factor (sigma-70 family)